MFITADVCQRTLLSDHERLMVAQAISALDDDQLEVVTSIYWGGFTDAEIAEDMGLSRRRVSTIKETAIRRMRCAISMVQVEAVAA